MRWSLAGHSIDALSIGGIETCFRVPSFDVCLDIGRCPPGAEKQSTLLLTHGHIDHAAGLPYYVSMRALMKSSSPRVFCPAESEPALRRILETWTELQADTDRCTLVQVHPGDTIPLRGGAFARAFRSPHRIACVGYTIFRRARKLLPELAGKREHEIKAARERGDPTTEEIDRPEICFPGDTRIEVVEQEPTVTRARLLLLECTFVGGDVSPVTAKRGGHVHLDHIAERASLFENEAILLTHFSRRHSREDIQLEVDRRLPEDLRKRVHVLANR